MSSSPTIYQQNREPAIIHAGDTITWSRMFPQYPASSGFMLAYTILSRTNTYQVAGSQVVADGDGFDVTILAAVTAPWVPGQYRWQAYIADGEGNRSTVGEGMIEVLPNLQVQANGFDDREPDEKMLDAIVALINGKVLSGDAQHYKIHERELTRYNFADLRALRSEYALKVRVIRVRRGERVPSRSVKVGFNA